jgi:AcrR family transcriptional regulator
MHSARINRMPESRRRRLVEVAAEEFASSGYRAASLNRIIANCGMSKSSFYYLIESKSDLFDFVVQDLMEEIGTELSIPEPEQFAGEDFWPRIAAFFAHLVGMAEQHPSFTTMGRMFYIGAPEDAAGSVVGILTAVQDWVERVLLVGRRCAAVRDDLPHALQYRLVIGILQVFDEWTVRHYREFTPVGLQELTDAQFATIRRALAA